MELGSLNLRFSSDVAKDFFFCGKRNILWNSGFGAGKSTTACQKILALMVEFPGYRVAMGRRNMTDLKKTLQQTFFKVCPPELYDPELGGRIVESPIPYLQFITVNGYNSRIYWVHLDPSTEKSLRSLEVNAAVVDQSEEVLESTYIELDNRVGRWDRVFVPAKYSDLPNWPHNEFTGAPMAPEYNIHLCNPPDEGEFSHLYVRYHPNSLEHQLKYSASHAYFQSASSDNKALPKSNLEVLMSRDDEWQARFVRGEFVAGAGAIHRIFPDSLLDPPAGWFEKEILPRATLTRVLDHGASAPTCCTWWASTRDFHIGYREYYYEDAIVSVHRHNIAALSPAAERYERNIADPAIFKMTMEKYGGFWSVAQEYADDSFTATDAPSILWSPGDNNELATRNRINEYLARSPFTKHPLTGAPNSPRLYFLKRSDAYPNGMHHVIRETSSQKKEFLAEINGKKVYSDKRDESITDHGYDNLRYFVASHLSGPREGTARKAGPGTFRGAQQRIRALKLLEENVA